MMIIHNQYPVCIQDFCACPSMSRCYHILGVKMFAGLPDVDDNSQVYFRSLSKRKLKKSDEKSDRKGPRANDKDVTVIPAPDSTREQNKTPKSKMNLTL